MYFFFFFSISMLLTAAEAAEARVRAARVNFIVERSLVGAGGRCLI
jgi:hypothetical protein